MKQKQENISEIQINPGTQGLLNKNSGITEPFYIACANLVCI